MLTLRPDSPADEVNAGIHRLEIILRESEKHPATVQERTETIWLGRLYKRQKKYSAAIQWLDRFLKRKEAQQELDKDYADVLYNKACYLTLDGKLDAALEALKVSHLPSPNK